MDRTVLLNDQEFIINGRKLFPTKSFLPYESNVPFTIKRKFICPKQVNDTVKIFFKGDFEINEVRADDVLLSPVKDDEGNITFDVTAALKRGKIFLTASFFKGRVDGFYFDVKRNLNV